MPRHHRPVIIAPETPTTYKRYKTNESLELRRVTLDIRQKSLDNDPKLCYNETMNVKDLNEKTVIANVPDSKKAERGLLYLNSDQESGKVVIGEKTLLFDEVKKVVETPLGLAVFLKNVRWQV